MVSLENLLCSVRGLPGNLFLENYQAGSCYNRFFRDDRDIDSITLGPDSVLGVTRKPDGEPDPSINKRVLITGT